MAGLLSGPGPPDSAVSSADPNPEDTGESLSDLSPMEHRGEDRLGILGDTRGDLAPSLEFLLLDFGPDTLTKSWDSLECEDLLDWREAGLEEAAEQMRSAVRARLIFCFCPPLAPLLFGLSLLASVAMKALASSLLVDG